MKKIFLLAAAAFLSLQACRKDPNNAPTPELEDDGASQESPQINALNAGMRDLESGALKQQLDTGHLAASANYVVLYKSSFRPPLADVYTGNDAGKADAFTAYERDTKASIRNRYPAGGVVVDADVISWYSTLCTGFYGTLAPEQVKTLYRDEAVAAICIPPDYEAEEAAPVYDTGTKPLFVHGYKTVAAASTKKIWIIDNGGSQLSPYLKVDPLSKSFVTNSLNVNADHGNDVAHIAAASMYNSDNLRGTASGAKVVMLKVGDGSTLSWDAINKALEYCWINSNNGDIVNMSLSGWASSNAAVLQMEKNVLKFEGWDMPVVIAGGNQDTPASYRTPARLGLKYKDDPLRYKFLYVVANCTPVGTAEQIKARTCTFKLNTDASSNYGRAIRYALVGTWYRRSVAGTVSIGSGTSYSAPTLSGMLYQETPSVHTLNATTQVLKYKRGSTYYTHLVPTLY